MLWRYLLNSDNVHRNLVLGPQVFMYYKACPDDNEYAHPMDLCPVVDLYAGKVIHIDAYEQPPAIPMRAANYHRYSQCSACICYNRFVLVGDVQQPVFPKAAYLQTVILVPNRPVPAIK
jgi:primary-amine oxidase